MQLPHQQIHLAALDPQGTGAKTHCYGKDRSPSEIYFEEGASVFCALKVGKRQGRFRVRRESTQEEKDTGAKNCGGGVVSCRRAQNREVVRSTMGCPVSCR